MDNNMHSKNTAIWLVESLSINPKQCNYKTQPVQLHKSVIALVVKNKMAARFAECSDQLIENLKEKSKNKNTTVSTNN